MTAAERAELARLVGVADTALAEALARSSGTSSRLESAMRHAVNAGGKRLRPVLCLAAAASIDTGADARRAAAALELVHTYSLIHDDLPCMDDADLRRGKPTVHRAFDEAAAVLAGDALLSLAFELTADHPAEAARELTLILARASGPAQLVGGQMEDTLGLLGPASAERLDAIQRGKTAAMIAAALEMGAVAAGAGQGARAAFREAGLSLGVAFQIADDLLDLEGDPSVVGKPTGADAARGKLTYHGLHGVEAARAKVRELTEACRSSLRATGGRTAFLEALAGSLIDRRN
jgi:geranylgeranyl pyrophosphate synthase